MRLEMFNIWISSFFVLTQILNVLLIGVHNTLGPYKKFENFKHHKIIELNGIVLIRFSLTADTTKFNIKINT